MEGYIAEIRLFASNFAPRNWAFCQGQLLPIAQNTALFSLIGTTYGGNGQTTFALPDFRGRVAGGTGSAPGLTPIISGQAAGTPTHTLVNGEMPMHNHTISGNTSGLANNANPTGNSLGIGAVSSNSSPVNMYNTAAPAAALNGQTCGIAGGSQPHNNMQPYLGMNYIICLFGIFPSRN